MDCNAAHYRLIYIIWIVSIAWIIWIMRIKKIICLVCSHYERCGGINAGIMVITPSTLEFGEMMNDLVDFLHPSHKATTMPEQLHGLYGLCGLKKLSV